MSKPTIVLIPGAWHAAEGTYSTIKSKLTKHSYPCIAVTLPTLGAEPPNLAIEDDIKAIQDTIIPLFDQGKEVVLVAHSYGGIPATASTKDHGIEERKAIGKLGGLKAIVYLTAFAIPKKGMSLLESLGGAFPSMVVIDGDYTSISPEGQDAFYNDFPKERSEALMKELFHHCIGPFISPVDYAASDLKIPSAYLVCKNDLILPQEFQDSLVASVLGMKRFECETGHCPMLSDPDVMVDVVVKVAGELQEREDDVD